MDQEVSPLFILVQAVVMLIFMALVLIPLWKTYTKAGKPGWSSIVPIYNVYVLLQIVGRPAWWLILYLIPGVNIVVSLINSVDLAKSFGKSETFGIVGLFLFSFVGYMMLGFGDATYKGPAALPQPVPATPLPASPPSPPTAS